MKKYFKYFRIPFIIFGCIFVVFSVVFYQNHFGKKYVRNNDVCPTSQRVFDFADLLTEEEEEKLEKLIAKKEAECGLDIVIVNLNVSLESMVHEVNPYAEIEDYAMIFADEFYESYAFGYDEPYGDGVILVDNQFREADGYKYLWFGTTGKAEAEFSSSEIDDVLIEVEDYIDTNSYRAYETFVKEVTKEMKGNYVDINMYENAFIFSVIIAFVYASINRPKKSKKTVTGRTFLTNMNMKVREDIFLRKVTHQRRIETSYSSSGGGHGGSRGGGGHHRSSSGRSHGGGGRRR